MESEYVKLMSLIDVLEKVFHPDLLFDLRAQINRAIQESKEDGIRLSGVSERALRIDREIEQMISYKRMNALTPFSVKCFGKRLLEEFVNETDQ